MNTKRAIVLLIQLCLLFACGDDEPKMESNNPVQDLTLIDNGNTGDGSDLFMSFRPPENGEDIEEYRLYISEAEEELESIIYAHSYTRIEKSETGFFSQLSAEITDINGSSIVEGKSYFASVASVLTNGSLGSLSPTIAFSLEQKPYFIVETLASVPQAEALTIDSKGNSLFTPGFGNNRLYKIDINTQETTTVGSGLSGPLGGSYTAKGEFYLSEWWTNSVRKYDRDFNSEVFANGISEPTGIAHDTQGNIYVASYNTASIIKVSSNGQTSVFAQSSFFINLDGLVFVGENLYAVNSKDSNVMKIAPSGSVSLFARLPSSILQDEDFTGYIAYNGDKLFIPSVRRIYSMDLEGNTSLIAGTGVSGRLDGPAPLAQFTDPNGVAFSISGDTLFIGDRNRIRMLIKKD